MVKWPKGSGVRIRELHRDEQVGEETKVDEVLIEQILAGEVSMNSYLVMDQLGALLADRHRRNDCVGSPSGEHVCLYCSEQKFNAEAAEGRAKGEAAEPGEVHFTAHGLFVEPAMQSDCLPAPPPAVEGAGLSEGEILASAESLWRNGYQNSDLISFQAGFQAALSARHD